MEREWIRGRDIPQIYQIGKTHAYELLGQFRAESSAWIKDGKVLIVRKEDFETWWRQRSQRNG